MMTRRPSAASQWLRSRLNALCPGLGQIGRSTAAVYAQRCTPAAARNSRRHVAARAQSGVGLIEVLVAVLVLSIGFLGIAALEATSLSTNNSAMARSMATINSYSILDAMRADIVNARGAKYNTTVTANACPTSTTTLAQAQLAQWCTQLGHVLGAVATTSGTVSCDATGNCTVTIAFDDSRAGTGGSANQTVITQGIL